MVSMTFVTPSPSHFDLSSDLNCWCERVHVCLCASQAAAWQHWPREAPKVSCFWFCFFLHHHAPSYSLTFTRSLSVSVSLFSLMLICSHRLSLTHWQSVTSPHIASLFWFLLKSVSVLGIKLQSVYRRNFMSIISHPRRRLTVGKFESRSENILFFT